MAADTAEEDDGASQQRPPPRDSSSSRRPKSGGHSSSSRRPKSGGHNSRRRRPRSGGHSSRRRRQNEERRLRDTRVDWSKKAPKPRSTNVDVATDALQNIVGELLRTRLYDRCNLRLLPQTEGRTNERTLWEQRVQGRSRQKKKKKKRTAQTIPRHGEKRALAVDAGRATRRTLAAATWSTCTGAATRRRERTLWAARPAPPHIRG